MSNKIKDTIIESIEFARGLGYTLVSNDWGVSAYKCACAIGCVLLQNDPADPVRIESIDNSRVAAIILGVSTDWIDSFIEGFDEIGIANDAKDPGAWSMGFDVSQNTNPTPYSDFESDRIKKEEGYLLG